MTQPPATPRAHDLPNQYDEFAQNYAKGAINAVILLNGGAAVAIISQLPKLVEMKIAVPASYALICWTAGLVVGAFIWLAAFLSTRFVSRSYSPNFLQRKEIQRSDRWMFTGFGAWLLSLVLFAAGSATLACGFIASAPLSAT